MNPTISVLLPVRNGAVTLSAALRSILDQTFADFEVLLLDDGSTDDGLSIAASLGDPRIRILSDGRQMGLASRLNQGVEIATGRYFARMDADDVSFPRRFEKQVAVLNASPEIDLVGTRAIVFREDGSVIGLLPFRATHDEITAAPWRSIPLAHPTWMGRAEWFRRHRYKVPEVRRAEDQELLLRACPTSQYVCLEEVLFGYRQPLRFNLLRTLTARRSLTVAQVRLFADRHQWFAVINCLGMALIKVSIDFLSTLPGCDRLFWRRMSAETTADDRATLARLIR